jgi:hypothetical protein
VGGQALAGRRNGSRPLTRFHVILCFIAVCTFAAEQPVPFSHKQHVALGIKCKDCHANPDPGESMGLPAASKCMACHVSIATDKPAIRKLKSFAKEPIPWVRVFQIPSTIVFSHRTHLEGTVPCDGCHPAVPRSDALTPKDLNISMGTCMACHRKSRVSNDCKTCHEDLER